MVPVSQVWEHLRGVTALHFKSQSHTGIGWEGEGAGVVKVSEIMLDVLIFEESGHWQQSGGKEIRFTNIYRWTKLEELLKLEHLRFGPDKPVFLFEMAPDKDGIWREVAPHLCKQDCYSAILQLDDARLLLNWLVRGPTRDEAISYVYF